MQAREKRYVSAPLIAAVSTALGDKEEAFRWLELAYEEHSGVLQWIAFLPEFRALHSDARFPHLLQRISASQDTILKITETTLSETNDPKAQSHFTLKVGVRPRPGTPNGHAVKIIVSFYDLTKDNKLMPTDAQVGYHWLTSAAGWTEADPRFLEATYVRPKTQTVSADVRRYGGFIVRVYFDGQLQDSRASPPDLLTLFPAEDQPTFPPMRPGTVTVAPNSNLPLVAACRLRTPHLTKRVLQLVKSHLVNPERCSHGALSPCFREQHRRSAPTERGGYSGLAIIAVVLSSLIGTHAQEFTPTPTPQTAGQPVATTFEVIVTGSNIPTAEEVGPNPVDTYRREDITRLGVRSAVDLVQKLPASTGAAINENFSDGDGRVEINLRGLLAKETLVLQDGRRLAPVGFAGDSRNLFSPQ